MKTQIAPLAPMQSEEEIDLNAIYSDDEIDLNIGSDDEVIVIEDDPPALMELEVEIEEIEFLVIGKKIVLLK